MGLPTPKPIVEDEILWENIRFLPTTLSSVDFYFNDLSEIKYGTLELDLVDGYRKYSGTNKYYLPSSWSKIIFTTSGYDVQYLENPIDENETYTITLHPAVAIPNITVNDLDYWETHKSEYNALIGNPIGTFKLDLSSYNTAADTLYAWTTTGYYDINDTTKPLIVYTLSETPAVNDKTYDSNGDEFDGSCWTGAEEGTVSNNINGVTSTTITLGMGKPTLAF